MVTGQARLEANTWLVTRKAYSKDVEYSILRKLIINNFTSIDRKLNAAGNDDKTPYRFWHFILLVTILSLGGITQQGVNPPHVLTVSKDQISLVSTALSLHILNFFKIYT